MLKKSLILSLLAMILMSCGSKEQAVLNVYNWSDYIDPAVLTEFENEFQVKLVYDTFASNEELLAKLQGGAAGYDVVVPSGYMVAIMIGENLLSPIDTSQIPNLKGLDPNFLNPPYDPKSQYSVPFAYGTSGLGYNYDEIGEELDSWGALWDPRFKGRILLLDDMREVFGLAYKYLGYSVNDTDPAHLEEAKQLLMDQKTNLLKYESAMNKDLLLTREALISHHWAGDIYQLIDEDSSFAFTIPKEGATLFTDCMTIPAAAPHKELAHKFINFILRPEITGRIVNKIWYAMPYPDALQYVDEEISSDPNIFPPDEILSRCEFIADLGDFTKDMDRAWTELKMK